MVDSGSFRESPSELDLETIVVSVVKEEKTLQLMSPDYRM